MSDALHKAFRRYQVMAWLVGSFLSVMTLALIAKYVFGRVAPFYEMGWQVHGFLYMGYLLATADLGVKARWSVTKMMTTAIYGTIPGMSFVAEHRLRRDFA